jgi:pimeloyl-ACP methyl ester carboxylesterase
MPIEEIAAKATAAVGEATTALQSGSDASLVLGALLVAVFFGGILGWTAVSYVFHYYDCRVHDDERPILALETYAKAVLREFWYDLAVVMSFPLGWLPHVSEMRYDPHGGPPIVLVHGYAANRACMFALYWRLYRRGLRNIRTLNLTPALASVPELGRSLGEELERISAACGGRPVIGVGHSMGGIVLRWCAQNGYDQHLQKIITLGSPHHGSRTAYLALGANARDLEPKSKVMRDLEAGSTDVPLVSLYSILDNVILPCHSSHFGTRTMAFNDFGHTGILFAKPVSDAVLGEIARDEDWGHARRAG